MDKASANSISDYWTAARARVAGLPAEAPPAWVFGATLSQANQLSALVVSGRKTATTSALHDYDQGEELPAPGDLSIILDGSGVPRAVIETVEVAIVRFDEVSAVHAWAEGEGDRSLDWWRREHQEFWSQHSPRGFSPDMLVVCQRFRVVYAG